MNGSGDIPLTLSSTPDSKTCSLVSVIPTLGMSSCRGRAEAFARRLSSKLRTLGSQTDEDQISQEEEPIINGNSTNTWVPAPESAQAVTDLQPLRHESDSFFDFDCELESPGSPVDECEYLRLIETASNTPHNSATESGYVCASAASSQSSSDGPYYDITNSESSSTVQPISRNTISALEFPEYVNSLKINGEGNERLCNGIGNHATEEYCGQTEDVKLLDSELLKHASYDVTDSLQTQDSKITGTKIPKANANATHQQDINRSVPVIVTVQDQIINELQQQSVEVRNTCHKSSHNIGKALDNRFQIEEHDPATITADSRTQAGVTPLPTNIVNSDNKKLSENNSTNSATSLTKSKEHDDAILRLKEKIDTNKLCADDEKLTKTKRSESSTHLGVLDTTDDEDDCRPQRVRRCSSLKTGKTPPGTPGRKKIVRFADVLGLDLADIKTFLDEIPTIPKSAFEDLEILDAEPIQLGPKSDKMLMPLFQQPGGMATFLDLVREKQVSLENAAVTDHINQTITGSVRVRNLDFHKSVHIRYTLDGWRSYADLQANYVENTCDGFSDRFTFVLFGNSMQIGQRLEFAVRFQCKGQQFWDNNYGTNYCFQCLPTSTPAINPVQQMIPPNNSRHMASANQFSPSTGDAWCTSFY